MLFNIINSSSIFPVGISGPKLTSFFPKLNATGIIGTLAFKAM
jgi:hypothetical protein